MTSICLFGMHRLNMIIPKVVKIFFFTGQVSKGMNSLLSWETEKMTATKTETSYSCELQGENNS